MSGFKIHQLIFGFCLLSGIRANPRPSPRCTKSPCPSPSKHLPPVTEFASFPTRLPVSQSTPRPTPAVNSGSMKPNKDVFFEHFFTTFQKLRQTSLRKPSASKGVDRTQYPGPTPSMQNPTSEGDFHLRVKTLTDGIISLFLSDVLGQRGEFPSAFVKATMHPYSTASPTENRQQRLKRSFFNFTVQAIREDPNFMAKFIASPKLDMENSSAVKMYVRSNIQKIAVGYWKLMSWFLTKLQLRSCGQDCVYIERMVQFCKNQNRMCGKTELKPGISSIRPSHMPKLMPSGMPNSMPNGKPSIRPSHIPKIMPSGMPNSMPHSASARPTPSPSIRPGGYCSSGNRNCPFKSGCFPYNVPCMNDRDIFNTMTRAQSISSLRPTQSMKEMSQPSSKAPSAPTFADRGYNRTMMEYAWLQASKEMPHLKLDDLARTYEVFYNYLRMDSNNQQQTAQSNEICSRICKKHNTTYCWAEMRCKQKGAKCSLKHLKGMMNRTAFENQGSCKGSFFCPVLQNCTSSDKSCDAGRFMQLPCDAKCMNATDGKGAKPSEEELQIFRLKCMDNEKYCPRRLGCVGSNESCSGSRKLNIPLGDGPEDERRAFCRMRDYICPRVYGAWKKMRCQQSEMVGPEVRPTERLPTIPRSFIPRSKSSMLKPMHTTKVEPTRTVNPQPKPPHTTLQSQVKTHTIGPNPKQPHTAMPTPTHATMSNGGVIHSTVIQPPRPRFSLPSFTLNERATLQSQIKLQRRVVYLAVSKFACSSSLEFYMTINRRTKLTIPDSSSGRGILLPLLMYLNYVSTESSFHGLCLLKYTVFPVNERGNPTQIVPIAAGTEAGTLAILISPAFGEISTTMIGKGFIDIKEDEVNPPCFKLEDKMQFNITGVQSGYNVPREFESLVDRDKLYEYQTKLSNIKKATIAAAVTGGKGMSFRSGNWKEMPYGQKFRNFPGYISEKNPLILDMNTCIAFYPAKDFSGKVSLTLVGVLKVFDNGRTKFIFGKKTVVVGVNILSEPDPPELTTEDSCLPPYPYDFDEAKNIGFEIETLLGIGKSKCDGGNKYYPLVQDAVTLKESRIGLTITKVSTCKFGHWEYKDGGAFKRVDIQGGAGLCLFKTARIRFVPANYTTLWSTKMAKQCIWIKAKAWISLTRNTTGHCNVTGDASNLLSKEEVQLSAIRRGCDDVAGSMRKPDGCGRCGKKRLSNIQCPCDGVLGSGAVTDECNYCTGGTTGLAFHKRDCGKECYANGTLSKNVVDSCGRCQNRKFVSQDARDCNGDCTFGRNRACKNKCGFCVGGRTRRPLSHGIDACGNCIANSSVACAKSLSLSKVIEVSRNQQFIMKITARGYSSLGRLACSLQITGGSSSAINLGIAYARRQSTIGQANSDMCAVQEVGDYEISLRAKIGTGGNYRLSCRVDQESSTTSVNQGEIKVINEQSSVDRIVPSEINSCRNESFILLGTGFKNSTDIACGAACERKCDFKTRGKFINSTAFACSIEVDGSKKDCEAQDVNLHALVSAAAAPPAFSKSLAKVRVQCVCPRAKSVTFNSLRRLLVIQLDKSASLAIKGRRSCNSFFESATVGLLGKSACYLSNDKILVLIDHRSPLMSSAAGSKETLVFNRANLRCQGKDEFSVMQDSAVQRLNVSLPYANLVPEIKGGSSVGTCDDIRLDGATSSDGMGGRINFNWGLYKDSTLVKNGGRRSWFKLSGNGLTPNGNYSVKLCISKDYGGRSNCKQLKLTVVDNSNNTLIVKMNGAKHRKLKAKGRYKFRPFVKLNKCGKRAIKVSRMLFTWQVKDMAGFILSTSESRSLDIKKGALKPGKNYTLQCSVRARLQSNEDVTGDTELTVEVEASPVKAKIRGGREMTVGCNEVADFDARPSTDPDSTDEPSRYFWTCNEKDGLPCFNKSNPLQRVSLMETARFGFNVGQNLECNKSYVFNVVYRKGLRQSNASIVVTLKPGEPAEVKLDQQQIRNKIILKGYVKTASSANVTWSCSKQEGFGFINMADVDIAMEVLPGPILVRGKRKIVRRKVLILNRDFLEEGAQYLLNLAAENADGRSDAQILVKMPSPPTAGEIAIDPPNGTALNTSFAISIGNGWTGEIANYDIGYEIETKKGTKRVRIKPNSVDNYMEEVQLPPGAKDKNQTLTIFITARNLDGLEVTSTKTVEVRQNLEINERMVKDSISLCDQATKERNGEKALSLIRATSETARTSNLIEDGDGKSVQQQLTEQIFNLMELKIGQNQDIYSALELTTNKEANGTKMPGDVRERGARLVCESHIPSASASSTVESKRKRRSVENSPSQEAFTPKSKEEVDSTMAIFDNLIEEEEPGSLQDNMKINFTNTVPFLVRSLCSNTLIANDYLLSKSNLSTIRSNRLPGYVLDTNNVNISDASNGSFIRLGSYLKEKYESWNCSTSGLLCTEICVGTILYHHHLFRGEFEGRISDIASVMLIHPETHGVENAGVMTTPLTYTMMLKEVPDSQHTVECRVWNSAGLNWTTDGCNTSYSRGSYATCHCLVLGNVTVFKVAMSVVTTLFPPITTAAAQTTSHSSSSPLNGSAVAPTNSTMRPAPKSSTSRPAIEVSFSFPVNYDDFASKEADLKNAITEMLSRKLNISKSRIVNLHIRPGSIIVTFTLLNNDGYGNEMNVADLQNQLTALASNGSLSLVFDGVTLTADPASLKFSLPKPTTHMPPPEKKSKKSHTVVIIVSVCVAAVIILVIIIVVWYVRFKKKRAKTIGSDMYGSTVLFGHDINLQERSLASQECIGYNAQRDSDSAEQVKKPLNDPAEPETEMPVQRTAKPEKSPYPAERMTHDNGGVVSVGIGSSTSLKKDFFTS